MAAWSKTVAPLDLMRRIRKPSVSCMPVKSSSRKSRSSREQTRALDVQIQFMEGVVRRDPRYVEALQLLGDSYTKRGRFTEGLTVDERLAQLEPENPLVFYNLACSYSLTDQCERAADAIEKALDLGYRDFKWLVKDPDLRKLRTHPRYEQIRETIKQLKPKRA
jgi:tetratricopeptide (TPR) repeat protein